MNQLVQLAQTPLGRQVARIAPVKSFHITWSQLSQLLKHTEFPQAWVFSKQIIKVMSKLSVARAHVSATAPSSPNPSPSKAAPPIVAALDLVLPLEMTESGFLDQLHKSFMITSLKGRTLPH